MNRLFLLVVLVMTLAFGPVAYADYHSFRTYDGVTHDNNAFLQGYNDIGHGFKATIVGVAYVFNAIRLQRGLEPLKGMDFFRAVFKESCKNKDGERVCEYTWTTRNFVKDHEKELIEADVNHDMLLTNEEAKVYYHSFKK
jgi:hypothetical protein